MCLDKFTMTSQSLPTPELKHTTPFIPHQLPTSKPSSTAKWNNTSPSNTSMSQLSPGTHAFKASNGITFKYSVCGTTTANLDKTLLIQCPGWGIGPRYLQSGLTPLENEYKLIFFHPRGSGGSSRPTDPATMTSFDMAADLDLFRQHLNIDRYPVLLGHSHGGTIVLAYAATFPRRVAKLILLDHRLLGHDDSAASRRYREERERGGDVRFADAYRALATDYPTNDEELGAFMTRISPLYFFDPTTHVPRYLEAVGDQGYSFWCLDQMRLCDRTAAIGKRMIDGLKHVTADTLIIFGGQDCQCTTENAEQTRDLGVDRATVVILDECGHFPWLEKPDETFILIRDFLDR
ncbi:alpha/beta hydrolase fold family protein [Blastomyces dermatitidis ATCC 18188]|uniref:Alpha/beta hydrolase fold family protein n=1 Tax=Ajellomyces dermatitidis (strain ATCC 18188 / CBS 674.68) TaxID=653446 RepID=F2T3Q0_AJEDA|nr:alpha/beta hydrolase fold family protein [Blastomyces dermatitidis ATCC 18188]